MDILTLAIIFSEFLPQGYYVAHVKDHATNETSFLVMRNRHFIARLVQGSIGSLQIQIFKAPDVLIQDVETVDQSHGRFVSAHPNMDGGVIYVEKGENYEDNRRYSAMQLRPVLAKGVQGKQKTPGAVSDGT